VRAAPTRASRLPVVSQANNVEAFRVLEDNAVQVVQRAVVEDSAEPQSTIRVGAIALVLGLFVGVGLALLRAPRLR
jgi:uncharacterized protein involved in exopolysaccharide biosynthesis